jgi:hypothetical protein
MVEEADSFSSCASTRALRRRPAVSTSSIRRPAWLQAISTASRVSPGSGPVSSRSSAISRLIRDDLPTLGRPTTARRIQSGRSSPGSAAAAASGSTAGGGGAMNGRSAISRSGRPSPCSAETAIGSPRPSDQASVEEDRLADAADDGGELGVERGDASARVDDEQAEIGGLEAGQALGGEPAGQGLLGARIHAGGVDHLERQLAQPGLTLEPVAGDAGQVVDQRTAAADQPVEERRLADVRPPQDRDRAHRLGRVPAQRKATSWPLSVTT